MPPIRTRDKGRASIKPAGTYPDDALTGRYQCSCPDFFLISSDGVQFRVKKVLLMGASSVFDSVLAQGSHYDNKLVLTDKDLERSAIVSPMLDLLRGKKISMESSGPSGYRLYRVVKLLQKYKCHAALTLVGVLIRNEAISGNSSAMHLFEAAALLHDVTSCHALIRRAKSWYNLSDRMAGLGRTDNVLALKSQMDPTSWNIATFESDLRASFERSCKPSLGDEAQVP